jgi:hypothetical protein
MFFSNKIKLSLQGLIFTSGFERKQALSKNSKTYTLYLSDHIYWIPAVNGSNSWTWTEGNSEKIWKSRNNSVAKLEDFLESVAFKTSKTII